MSARPLVGSRPSVSRGGLAARRSPMALVAATALVLAPWAARAQGPSMAEMAEPAADAAPADAGMAQPLTTVAYAALTNYDALIADIGFLGELVGRPEASQMVEGMVALFTQGRGLEGIDKTRPIGAVVQTDGQQFSQLFCLPVTDLDSVLEVVSGFGFDPIDAGDGVMEIETPNATFFVKPVGEWTYVAQSEEALATAPADPSKMLAELVSEYDLAVRVMVPNIPEMYRSIAIEQMRAGMEQGLVQQEEETDEEFQFRRDLAEAQVAQLTDFVSGLDQVTAGWTLDAPTKSTHLDLALTVLPESKFAAAVQTYKNAATDYAGFHRPGSALSMYGVGDTPPEYIEEQRAQLESAVRMMRMQADKAIAQMKEEGKINDQAAASIQEATGELIDVYQEMLVSGHGDLAVSVDLGAMAEGERSADGAAIIAGGAVPNPSKVESAFRKLADAAATLEGFPGVEWKFADHNGITLHRMVVPTPADEPVARELFGESVPVLLGVGAKSVYFAAGPAGQEQLEAAIDGSSSMAGAKVDPFEFTVSIGQVLAAASALAPEGQAQEVLNLVRDSLKDSPADKDHVRVQGKPLPSGVLIRYEAEEGVLRVIGAAAAAAQAQAQAAQQ